MRRPALSATRSLDIIDLLAAAQGEPLTMSQIARATEVNVATCHAILNELAARGYVSRHPAQKTYTLGPALVGIGNAAARSQQVISYAQQLAEGLNREFGVPVALTRLIGDEVVGIFAVHTAGEAGSNGARPGARLPLMAPVGAPFLAWSSEEQIAAWIARRPDDPGAELVARWRRELDRVRERGYQVLMRSPARAYFPKLLSGLAAGEKLLNHKSYINEYVESSDQAMRQIENIEPQQMYEVMLIAAPIFDESRQVVYNLCIGDIAGKISGEMIQNLADRLLQTCVQIMSRSAAG